MPSIPNAEYLSERENTAIDEMAAKLDVTPGRVLKMAVAAYQLVVMGTHELREINPSPKLAPAVPSNSCNRHVDCKIADAIWLDKHPGERFVPFSFHCHNDECEDCFGC